MLIFWKERLVFLANAKTGSTSIEAALEGLAEVAVTRPAPLRHTTAQHFGRHVAPWLADLTGGARFTTVALVRDPLDWLGSWFRDRSGAGDLPPGADFASFGQDVLALPPPGHARLVTQSQMLCDADGQPLVDALFRYDAIDHFVGFLEDRLGCEITLPRLKVSPYAPTDLPGDLRARLSAHLAADARLHAGARG